MVGEEVQESHSSFPQGNWGESKWASTYNWLHGPMLRIHTFYMQTQYENSYGKEEDAEEQVAN